MSEEVKLFLNPQYQKLQPSMLLHELLYKGDQEALKDPCYLWPHELETKREGEPIRKLREMRTHYSNYIEPLVTIWQGLFFRKEPEISDEVRALLGPAVDDIDGKGTSFLNFIKNEVFPSYIVHGRVFLKVDAFADAPMTLAEEKEKKVSPYFELIDPLCFVDWGFDNSAPDKMGKFLFAREEYLYQEPRTSAESEPVMRLRSKQYFLDEGRLLVRTYQAKEKEKGKRKGKKSKSEDPISWEVVSTQDLGVWSEIPIAYVMTDSWIKDAAVEALKYFNLVSVIDNINLFQGHQRVYFIGNFDQNFNRAALAEYTLQVLPEGTTIHETQPTNTAGIEARADSVFNAIWRVGLNQVRQMAADSKAVQGEATLREEKDYTVSLVQSELASLENIINQALKHFAMFKGQPNFEGKISFSADITKADVEKVTQIAMSFKDDINKVPKFRKAMLKWAANEIDLPEKEEILEEIDSQDLDSQADSAGAFGKLGAVNGAEDGGDQNSQRPSPILQAVAEGYKNGA